MNATELKVWLDHKRQHRLLLDVRERREYRRGHIPEGELFPLRDLVREASSMSRDQEIVLVCRSGRRSTRAAGILQNMGFSSVHVLKGGMLAWEASGYPVMVQ